MQSELQNTQKLQQSVVVLGRAKRELVKAAASIEEVGRSQQLPLSVLMLGVNVSIPLMPSHKVQHELERRSLISITIKSYQVCIVLFAIVSLLYNYIWSRSCGVLCSH